MSRAPSLSMSPGDCLSCTGTGEARRLCEGAVATIEQQLVRAALPTGVEVAVAVRVAEATEVGMLLLTGKRPM